MSLTTITITTTEKRANGEAAQGTITATLSETIHNGSEAIDPTPIVGELNSEGKLKSQSGTPFTLIANDDTATTPAGSTYTFLIELDNAPVRSFAAVVKHTSADGTVTIGELE